MSKTELTTENLRRAIIVAAQDADLERLRVLVAQIPETIAGDAVSAREMFVAFDDVMGTGHDALAHDFLVSVEPSLRFPSPKVTREQLCEMMSSGMNATISHVITGHRFVDWRDIRELIELARDHMDTPVMPGGEVRVSSHDPNAPHSRTNVAIVLLEKSARQVAMDIELAPVEDLVEGTAEYEFACSVLSRRIYSGYEPHPETVTYAHQLGSDEHIARTIQCKWHVPTPKDVQNYFRYGHVNSLIAVANAHPDPYLRMHNGPLLTEEIPYVCEQGQFDIALGHALEGTSPLWEKFVGKMISNGYVPTPNQATGISTLTRTSATPAQSGLATAGR